MRHHFDTQYERVEESMGRKFVTLKTGRTMFFWDMMTRADRDFTAYARAVARCFKLVNTDFDLERLEQRVEHLEEYAAALREEIKKRYKYKSKKERIAALRNVEGRTPEEAAAFLRKADELERKMGDS